MTGVQTCVLPISHLRGFFVLGDLPELRNFGVMLPGMEVRSLPFPKISPVSLDGDSNARNPVNDFLFTGVVTTYREDILSALGKKGFRIENPKSFLSRKRRDLMSRNSKVVLNIPQREDWRWLSLMRVISALRSGRPTVSLGTNDQSQIAACCFQIDTRDPDWSARLKERLDTGHELYRTAFSAYCRLASQFEAKNPFPHSMFELWAITDRLSY